MRWSPQQEAALKTVSEWYNDPHQQVCRVFGYAGTGKTTLAKHFADDIDGSVLYGAYTGKAAYVLRSMGCSNATTIHSLIYRSKERGRARLKELEENLVMLRQELLAESPPDVSLEQIDEHQRITDIKALIAQERTDLSRPIFSLNPDSPVRSAKLVVIDECSMVDGLMGQDLLSFGCKVLVLGDPAQLPPVGGGGFFTEDVKPDVMLTDIHRQAKDNPIIAMATKVRNQEKLEIGRYGESEVCNRKLSPEEVMEFSQVLVGRNKTRHASNRRIRSLLGRTEDLPVASDKLVCLRNDHDLGLLNGQIWHVEDIGELSPDRVVMTLLPDQSEGMKVEVEAHTHHFIGQEAKLPWWEAKEAQEFDYGYAMTVHKAQGSQWKNVLLFDESWCFRKDRWRWLYTGLTRAADRVVVAEL